MRETLYGGRVNRAGKKGWRRRKRKQGERERGSTRKKNGELIGRGLMKKNWQFGII